MTAEASCIQWIKVPRIEPLILTLLKMLWECGLTLIEWNLAEMADTALVSISWLQALARQ